MWCDTSALCNSSRKSLGLVAIQISKAWYAKKIKVELTYTHQSLFTGVEDVLLHMREKYLKPLWLQKELCDRLSQVMSVKSESVGSENEENLGVWSHKEGTHVNLRSSRF